MERGRVNARTAEKALDAYYRFGLQHEQLFHRARVRTPWTRLARHAAERKRASLAPDPEVVEGILKGSPLVITMIKRGFHKDSDQPLGYVSGPRGRKTYAPSLRRGEPRPVKQENRIVAYEAEMEGMFSLEGINPRKSVSLKVRLEQGEHLAIGFPLWRQK